MLLQFTCKIFLRIFFVFYLLQNVPLPIKFGPQEFSCPICPKITQRRDVMQTHIFSHTGERPFECPYCPQKFSQNGHMHRHIRKNHQ